MAATTVPTGNLLSELSTLTAQFTSNPVHAREVGQQRAIELARDTLLTSPVATGHFEENARTAATEGRKTCRLASWSLREDLRFNGRYLLDLLNRHELLGMLQDWLDEHYSTGDQRFRVFHHKVAHTQDDFALTVSWDQAGFGDIDDIIRRNREMATAGDRDREHRPRSYVPDGAPRDGASRDASARNAPYGGAPSYGEGGRGRGRGDGGRGRGRGDGGRGRGRGRGGSEYSGRRFEPTSLTSEAPPADAPLVRNFTNFRPRVTAPQASQSAASLE